MLSRFGLTAAVAVTLCNPAMAWSGEADPVAHVLKALRSQGYREIWLERTLLNRVRIVADRSGYSREIVVDPRTGDILRDYSDLQEGVVSEGRSGDMLPGDDGQAGKDTSRRQGASEGRSTASDGGSESGKSDGRSERDDGGERSERGGGHSEGGGNHDSDGQDGSDD